MTYKEALFFTAQCLTINLDEKNRQIISSKIKLKKIDWNKIVKVSTDHLVFPALYQNLKQARLLKYLTEELVLYMKEISDLNKARNLKIIAQVHELNKFLLRNNILPIFIKGSGNLVEGLYQDNSERMVGDIDLICSKKDFRKAIKLLTTNGYYCLDKEKDNFPDFKHYGRLIKKNRIAAVEIHKELTIKKYASEFNFNTIFKNIYKINDISILGLNDKIALSIISNQINDYGFNFREISLRNAYDVFLLSKKQKTKINFSNFNKLNKPLSFFIAICHEVFGKVDSFKYTKTKESEKFLSVYKSLLKNKTRRKFRRKLKRFEIYIWAVASILSQSLFNKEIRKLIIRKTLRKTGLNKI